MVRVKSGLVLNTHSFDCSAIIQKSPILMTSVELPNVFLFGSEGTGTARVPMQVVRSILVTSGSHSHRAPLPCLLQCFSHYRVIYVI